MSVIRFPSPSSPDVFSREELSEQARDLEEEIISLLTEKGEIAPGPCVLALLRCAGALIAQAENEGQLSLALECATDILRKRACAMHKGACSTTH